MYVSSIMHKQVPLRTSSSGDVLSEVDVTLFGIENDAAIIHVIPLATDSTGGNAVTAHRQAILGVVGTIVLTHAVGTLLVIGCKAPIG